MADGPTRVDKGTPQALPVLVVLADVRVCFFKLGVRRHGLASWGLQISRSAPRRKNHASGGCADALGASDWASDVIGPYPRASALPNRTIFCRDWPASPVTLHTKRWIMAKQDTKRQNRGSVLVVEDDPVVGDVVLTLLLDEGYAVALLGVALLGVPSPDAIRAAVGRLEPDCILLDGTGSGSKYGKSWAHAAWAHARHRPVPVVMFTGDPAALAEAEARESARSAAIYAVAARPFDIDDLLDTVACAVGSVLRFDRSAAAEMGRTAALVARLSAAGATDVRSSTRREWMNFYAGDALTVLYWSQRDGAYYVLRQPQEMGGFSRWAASMIWTPPSPLPSWAKPHHREE